MKHHGAAETSGFFHPGLLVVRFEASSQVEVDLTRALLKTSFIHVFQRVPKIDPACTATRHR